MRNLSVILFLLAAVCSLSAHAGDSTSVHARSIGWHEWGATFGLGFINGGIRGNSYGPFLLMGELECHLRSKNRDPESKHFFLLYAEPQLNPVLTGGGIKEWEAGINFGARYLLRMKERNGLVFYIGSGPQYVSQSFGPGTNGFAFANNAGLAFERDFKRDIKIVAGYRYRYLAHPESSKGLQNHFFTIGFKKTFPQRLQLRKERRSESMPES